MFRTFVVPLDGSELAERALPYAVRLALARRGRLVLLDVVAPPPVDLNTETAYPAPFLAELVTQAGNYLTSVAEKLATRVPVETHVNVGSIAAEILHEAQQLDADGIIMASRGRVGPAHLVFGSVAESVLANSPVPVFLVHAQAGEAPGAPFEPMSARMLVPLDGSEFAEAALETALDVLGPAGEIILNTVVQPTNAAAREYLECQASRLRKEIPDLHVTTDIRTGDPAEGIIAAAIDRNVDLVVMASHGRTGIRRAVLGSVAGAVLHSGSTPVLVVGPAATVASSNPLG
jgi:nucleotide-binding universal stress UspA family protein